MIFFFKIIGLSIVINFQTLNFIKFIFVNYNIIHNYAPLEPLFHTTQTWPTNIDKTLLKLGILDSSWEV
jgi:hypothetical protein